MFLNNVVVGIDIASDSFVAAILAPDPNFSVLYRSKLYIKYNYII
jgi:hypothetical protein